MNNALREKLSDIPTVANFATVQKKRSQLVANCDQCGRTLRSQKVTLEIGASFKDLEKKWFAFSKMKMDAKEILERLES